MTEDAAAATGRIARAYDRTARLYDGEVAPSGWARTRLWERMDAHFPPGSSVLDVTAGTGIDAHHLSRRGVKVVACDCSPGMLAVLRDRCPDVETHRADFHALDVPLAGRSFDGVISTFAGLSTSSDLRPFARQAAKLLPSGGVLFIHMLNRWRPLAWRSWRAMLAARLVVELHGVEVPHTLYSPLPLYRRCFSRDFALLRASGQGIVIRGERPVGRKLDARDRWLGERAPFHSLGLFFLLEMRRR